MTGASICRGFVAAALIALAGCDGTKTTAPAEPYVPPAEGWTFGFADGRTWEAVEQTRTRESALVIYVLPGQTKEEWSELVTTGLTFGGHRRATVAQLAEITRKALEKDCQGLKWEILEESEKSIMYEWRHFGCKDKQPGQHEIARLTVGRLGIHRLAYDSRTGRIPRGLRRQWVKAISQATVGPLER